MSKPIYSRHNLGHPCLGLRHSCWTEPRGSFEPPSKMAPFFNTLFKSDKINLPMKLLRRWLQLLDRNMFKQWSLLEWKIIAAVLLFHRILYVCVCSKDTCFQYLGFPSTDVVVCIFVEMDNFHSALLTFLSLISFEWMEILKCCWCCCCVYSTICTLTKRNGQIFTI